MFITNCNFTCNVRVCMQCLCACMVGHSPTVSFGRCAESAASKGDATFCPLDLGSMFATSKVFLFFHIVYAGIARYAIMGLWYPVLLSHTCKCLASWNTYSCVNSFCAVPTTLQCLLPRPLVQPYKCNCLQQQCST